VTKIIAFYLIAHNLIRILMIKAARVHHLPLEAILYPVPHRHFTLGIPKMLRPYFRYDRSLLKDLCRIAHQCLIEFMQTTLDAFRFQCPPEQREDIERLAQDIIHNPFSLDKM